MKGNLLLSFKTFFAAPLIFLGVAVQTAQSDELNHRKQDMHKLESALQILEKLGSEYGEDLTPHHEAADKIQRLSGQTMIRHFSARSSEPEGSGLKEMDWQDMQKFDALALQLHIFSEGLRASLKDHPRAKREQANMVLLEGNPDRMFEGVEMPDMRKMSLFPATKIIPFIRENCNSCHTQFRKHN